MIGSTASTSTHRSIASPCISSTKLRSPHTSCLVSTRTAWSQLPPPLLLFGLRIAGGASRPACAHPLPQVHGQANGVRRRFLFGWVHVLQFLIQCSAVTPTPKALGCGMWAVVGVSETWPARTCQRSSGLPSFLSLPFVGPDLVAPRWHLIILGVRLIILRVSGAPCGPILMSHMWPVKKDPSDLPIRLITTQYILMSRVRSYTYNIHIHSTHAGIYICV